MTMTPAFGEWQPIKTAPKDGTKILIFRRVTYGGRITVGTWDNDGYATEPRPYWRDSSSGHGVALMRTNPPTHWMPLPPPPADEVPA